MPKPKRTAQTETKATTAVAPLQPTYTAMHEVVPLAEQQRLRTDDAQALYRDAQGDIEKQPPMTKASAGQSAKRRPPSKLPGYVEPGRAGKVSLKAFVDPELRDAFKAIAKLNGTTVESLLTDVVSAVVEQYQQPGKVQVTVAKTVAGYRKAVSKAALRLVAAAIK